jgi:hypothetical protein
MDFRLRRSARLGPLRFNFSKAGLSSISVGGRGASFIIPVSRAGGARTTVGLPGTGLSWSLEHSPAQGLPNSRRLRSGQLEALKQELLALLKLPYPRLQRRAAVGVCDSEACTARSTRRRASWMTSCSQVPHADHYQRCDLEKQGLSEIE